MPTTPGPGVDAQGRAVIDPTQNVQDMMNSAVNRLDDLRTITADGLRREMELRAMYDEKLRDAETARINAIRLVDTQNVQRTAEVQAAQALALANQVTTSAEALRAQVAAASTSQDGKLAEALDPIRKDIADLRKVQYETAGGKTQVVEARANTGDTRSSMSMVIAAVVGFATIMLSISAIAVTVLLR